jgi:hypothetical protein
MVMLQTPTFMGEKDERKLRKKWVYTRQRYEDRYGTIGGKTTIKEIDDVLRNEHYKPGATQIFRGKCDDVEVEKKSNSVNKRVLWMKLAWIEEAKKNLRKLEKIRRFRNFLKERLMKFQ